MIAAAAAGPAHSAPAAACSPAFKAAWDKAKAGRQVAIALGPLGSVAASSFAISGQCTSDKTFAFSGGTVRLLTGTLAAGAAKGLVSNTSVCISSAAFTAPAAWRLGAITVSTAAPFCAPISGLGPLTGKLQASGTPFYSLAGLSRAPSSITFAPGSVALAYAGRLAGAGNAAIAAALKVDGTFTGNVTINAVRFLGQTLTVSGPIGGDRTGIRSSKVAGGAAGPFAVVDGLSASNLRLNLNPQAFIVTADTVLGVPNTAATRVAGPVANLGSWSLPLATSRSTSWTPIKGLTLKPQFVGRLNGGTNTVTFDATAPAGGAVWRPRPGVQVQVQSIEVANTKPPAECSSAIGADHVWLKLTGPGSVGLLGPTRPAAALGCADLEAGTFDLRLTPSLTSQVITSGLTLRSSTFHLVGDTQTGVKTLSVIGSMVGTVAGKPINLSAVAYVLENGTLVVGGNANSIVGGMIPGALGGILYFATGEVKDFDTQDAQLGTIDLPAGISLALTYGIDPTTSSQLRTALTRLGLPAPATGRVVAQATLDAAGQQFELKIALELTSPHPLFVTCPDGRASCDASQTTSLTPHSAYLQISSQKTFTIGVDALLHLSSMVPGGSDSTLETHAELELDLKRLTAQIAIFHKGSWVDAFALPGLTLTRLGIQGGLSFKTAIPVPSIGFIATATHLPDNWAKVLGYTQGGPLTIGLNISITNPIVHIEFGASGGSTVVLRPLAPYGAAVADDLQVRYGQLVIAPFGGVLGGENYDEGVSFAFEGTVLGFPVNAGGSFTTDPAGFSIDLDVPAITLPNTSIVLGDPTDGTHLHIAANTVGFSVEFSGGLKFSGFDFQAKLSLQTTGNLAIDASLTTTGSFLVNAGLTGVFNPAAGAFSMTGTGKISVVGQASLDTTVTVDTSGVSVSFDVSTPIGGVHFGGTINSGGFDLSASVNLDVGGSATITNIAQVSGSIHVGGSAEISTASGFSVTVSASFKGSGCLYDAFNGNYDIACISIDLGTGSVSIASDLKSVSFSILGQNWSIPF